MRVVIFSLVVCIVTVMSEANIELTQPNKHTNSAHYRPTSETPFEWHFAGGPIVDLKHTLNKKLAELMLIGRQHVVKGHTVKWRAYK